MTDPPDESGAGLARVLAALTAVAGLSALVAFTGAAIVWVRYQEAKLPADQAVAVTPEPSLIAVGGVALGVFALVAGLAVLVAYLVDPEGTRRGQLVGVILLGGAGLAVAILLTDASAKARVIAVGVTAIGVAASIALAVVVSDHPLCGWLTRNRWWLLLGGDAVVLAAALVVWLVLHETLAAIVIGVAAVVLSALLALAFVDASDKDDWIVKAIAFAGGIVRFLAVPTGVALLALVLYLILDAWWIAIAVVLDAALITGVLLVAHATKLKFRWYGAAVFVAVVIFGAAMHALRTWEDPRLQPMAVLFTAEAGGGGQSGLFVSQSSDHVYLGLVHRCRRDPDLVLRPGGVVAGSGQIVSIPRASLAAESVGTVGQLNDALRRAPALLDELGKRFAPAGTTLASLPVDQCSDEGTVDLKRRVSTPVDPAKAAELAARFRPVLKFDSDERWRPLNIDRLLAERDQRLCDGTKEDELHCVPIATPSQIAAAPNSPGAYVNLRGMQLGGADYRTPDLARCPRPQPQVLQDCDRGPASTIYYHAVSANGRTYIDYWWFLRFNRFDKHNASQLCNSVLTRKDSCQDHEGDWEGVTAVTQRGSDRLEFVDYAAHQGVFRYPVAQIAFEDGRPLVYLARGSHAAYPRACPKNCEQVARLFGHALPEDNTDGQADWGRNADADCRPVTDCLQALPTGSWGAFAGLWGSQTCRRQSGSCRFGVPPRSPSRQHRFLAPWCYTAAGLRLSCDGTVPGS